MQDIQPFVDEIIGYANLPEDWDTYGAKKISQKMIQQTLEYLHLVDELPYDVVPLSNGSIDITYQGAIYEISMSVEEDGLWDYLVILDTPTTVYFYDEGRVPLEEMVQITKRWIHERDTTIPAKSHFTPSKDSNGN